MAKRTRDRRALREEHEAAEKRGAAAAPEDGADAKKAREPKKKAPAKPKRAKAKVVLRKRLLWGVFSSSMKEEGRFPYGEREAAESRAAELTQKHKRTYFVHPIKEPIGEKEAAETAE